MRDETVARNYAETLFELAQRNEGLEAYGEGIEAVARLIDENSDVRRFLETPRISGVEKKVVLERVFGEVVPRSLLNFLRITVDKRRQRLLRAIAEQYHALLDAHLGRQHVEVTLARPVDDDVMTQISDGFSKVIGKKAIPHVRIRPGILGGIVVRAGDTIYDGSLRRKLDRMRKRLLGAELPDAN